MQRLRSWLSEKLGITRTDYRRSMDTETDKKDTSLQALLPDWLANPDLVSVRRTAYRVLSLTKEALPNGDFVKFDLGDVRAFLFHGKIDFFDIGTVEVYLTEPGTYRFVASEVERRETEIGLYLVLMAPVIGPQGDAGEIALQNIRSATGLIAAFKGVNTRSKVHQRAEAKIHQLERGRWVDGFASGRGSARGIAPSLLLRRANFVKRAES